MKILKSAALLQMALITQLGMAQAQEHPMGFFVTSIGLGDGANLGGLDGADAHCDALATAARIEGRTWRAYLGTQEGGKRGVSARYRIGSGPWYNAHGELVASDLDELHLSPNIIKRTAVDENGKKINGVGDNPNEHDILTGSMADVRSSIDRALEEIRAISRGLALPELDELDMPSLVKRAVTERETQSGNSIDVTFEGPELKWLSYADKLCVYRFLQEGLSNAFRHGGVEQAQVFVQSSIEGLRISVKDKGSGFDMNEAVRLYDEGGQGLNGLKDRSESIGGKLEIVSEIGLGTTLTLHIPNEESA